jgi:hypothetical protein
MQQLIGIDIGYLNMGISFCQVDTSLNIDTFNVEHVAKINLRLLEGNGIHEEVDNFANKYILPKITPTTIVLIERQPPTGLTAIEYLLLHILKGYQVIRVAPNSLHKHFQIRLLSYERRKDYIENYVRKYFKSESLIEKFDCMSRKHDVADSIIFCVFYCNINKKHAKLNDYSSLEQFRFVPVCEKVRRSGFDIDGISVRSQEDEG